jgi:hypothetical protein
MTYEDFLYLEGLVLVTVLLILFIAVPVLFLYWVSHMVYRVWRHRPLRGTVLRALAYLGTCVAGALYFWGCLYLLPDDKQSTQECQATVPPEFAGERLYYEISFVPLNSRCHVAGGDTYPLRTNKEHGIAAVPGYVNPVGILATVTALAAGAAVRRFPDEDPSVLEPADETTV